MVDFHLILTSVAFFGSKANILLISSGLILTIALYFAGQHFLSTSRGFIDLLTSIFSILATFLLVYRFIDNWIYWIFIDLIYQILVIIIFRFCEEVEIMTSRKVPFIFKILWKYISPLAIFVILVLSLYGMAKDQPRYDAWDSVHVSKSKSLNKRSI